MIVNPDNLNQAEMPVLEIGVETADGPPVVSELLGTAIKTSPALPNLAPAVGGRVGFVRRP